MIGSALAVFAPFIALGVALALNHATLVLWSTRRFRTPDFVFFAWCLAYPFAMYPCITLGLMINGVFGDYSRSLAYLGAYAALVVLPATVTIYLAAWAWKSLWPPIGLAGVSLLAPVWLATLSDWSHAFLTAGVVWNLVYAVSCLPPIYRERTRRQRSRENRCMKCVYLRAGLAPDTPCPECGTHQPA